MKKNLFNLKLIIIIIAFIILGRFIALNMIYYFNIVNDSGITVKFAGIPAYYDYSLYVKFTETPFINLNRPLIFIFIALNDLSEAWNWLIKQEISPGPIFPSLLLIFNYKDDRFNLSLIYLFIGIIISIIWSLFATKKNHSYLLIALASSFPLLVYSSFIISTDLIFAFIISLFYYYSNQFFLGKKKALKICLILLLILILTRPNALSMIPFMLILIKINKSINPKQLIINYLILGVIGLYMLIYYLPYYLVHDINSSNTTYWGLKPSEYYAGIFDSINPVLSKIISLFIYAISKFIYASGIRPSYSNVEISIIIFRILPGLIILPGLLYGIFRGQFFDKLFVLFFLIPFFFGATQERYLLSIVPILLIWGYEFYNGIYNKLKLYA
jgi:hypothetical protein